MSIGIGGLAIKAFEDSQIVEYKYGGYNLNSPQYRNAQKLLDGTITIQKSCLVEPEIHQKIRRMPNSRKKLITKRVHVDIGFEKLFLSGAITVANCSNCWQVSPDEMSIDIIAAHIIFKLFHDYQDTGVLPERTGYNV